MNEYLIIEAKREEYNYNKIENTMTAGELMDFLREYEPDTKIVISNDNGYTYGAIKHVTYEYEEV